MNNSTPTPPPSVPQGMKEIRECAEAIVRNLREDISPALRDDIWVTTAACHAVVILQDLAAIAPQGVPMKPTQEQMRVACAEQLGWHRCGPYTVGRSGNQRTVWKGIHPRTSMQAELPDYPNNLDAMHEAEKWMFETKGVHYSKEYYGQLLPAVVGGSEGCWMVVSATALQRCEAFLRVVQPDLFAEGKP